MALDQSSGGPGRQLLFITSPLTRNVEIQQNQRACDMPPVLLRIFLSHTQQMQGPAREPQQSLKLHREWRRVLLSPILVTGRRVSRSAPCVRSVQEQHAEKLTSGLKYKQGCGFSVQRQRSINQAVSTTIGQSRS
jgi:hypothetical protein